MFGKLLLSFPQYSSHRALCRNLWEVSQNMANQATNTKHALCLCQVTHDAWEGVLFLQKELHAIEDRLDISKRWTPDSPQFQCATRYLQIRTFQRAVDKLEGLVVQRLFELNKANVSQMGEFESQSRWRGGVH